MDRSFLNQFKIGWKLTNFNKIIGHEMEDFKSYSNVIPRDNC